MLHISITYITENTISNRMNLVDCLAVYSTDKKKVRPENLPTKEAMNVRTKLIGTYTA
jgi:hypothetical protein